MTLSARDVTTGLLVNGSLLANTKCFHTYAEKNPEKEKDGPNARRKQNNEPTHKPKREKQIRIALISSSGLRTRRNVDQTGKLAPYARQTRKQTQWEKREKGSFRETRKETVRGPACDNGVEEEGVKDTPDENRTPLKTCLHLAHLYRSGNGAGGWAAAGGGVGELAVVVAVEGDPRPLPGGWW